MANSAEPSSSISFTSTSQVSNGSISYNISPSGAETGSSLEIISLSKLSCNLEQLLIDSSCDYSDAEIIVESVPVGVHRCILAARSKFFHELFKKEKGASEKEGSKPKYSMSDLLPYGSVGYEAFLIFLSYLYTGKLKPFPPEVSTCVDNECAHDACRPAIDFSVELMYASSVFQVPELASLSQRRLLNFVGKALVEDVIPILVVAFHCQSTQLVTQCVDRVARSDLDTICLEKELPFEVSENIKLLRLNSQADDKNEMRPPDPLHEKRVRRIHKALDSDDVELVKLLLSESNITLDEAYALHYAAAYCDPKVVSEVLGLGLANVNLLNARGYTVLHVAATRKEPSIIVSLLNKGAHASEMTSDGRSAVSICRRQTRPKDYHAKKEQGQETNKDRICIDVLEREMWRNPMAAEVSMSSPTIADDLHMKLLYLENRVAFARLFFPTEAKLAMDIAHAETTSPYAGRLASRGSSGNLREVDLNETPIMRQKRLQSRVEALSKTVEMGRRYFPHCSQVLDKFMEDDLPDLLDKGTPEEQRIKRTRFLELKEDVQKAFNKDKAELHRSGLSSSASSSSMKNGAQHKIRRLT
ncbi:BTB/POZ domain and ankyrin repeat-containing protein NPR1-like [Rhododendron vialii]|uniref:BTB/POZ domain and ankyrin repeat-containing protein NPR1-like n=1 Tax=Rhododendron vialii TaxID=182163 RepID=UPI00265D83C7|nr:BTB/POZ domain and ankyrin repeat-containing protein NPR1-like [Rhododendron vialii]